MSDNPFQSPRVLSEPNAVESNPSLDDAAEVLRQTRPWVRFISILMFLAGSALIILGLFFVSMGMSNRPGAPPALIGLIYVAMSLIYVVPSVFLWMYADRINLFLRERTVTSLTTALQAQKYFWRFIGIMMIIVMCLYAALFIMAMGATALISR